jgi:PAS domain S-box-containing protein
VETTYRAKDGREIPVLFSGSGMLDKTNRIQGIICTAQDITERKEAEKKLQKSEKQFRDLVENLLSGVSIIQNDELVYRNPEMQRLFGTLPDSYKFSMFATLHPDDIEAFEESYRDVLSGKKESARVNFRIYPFEHLNDEKKMKWVHGLVSSIEYQGERAVMYNLMDVSRAKELEEILGLQDKMVSLGRISAGIAHEIRNPLAGINMYLAAMKKTLERPDLPEKEHLAKVHGIVDKVQSASNKIEGVIKRVMDFSKPSGTQLTLMDINGPIEEALNLASSALRKNDITLYKSIGRNLPKCYADTPLMEQIFLNLITNAMEAMKDWDGPRQMEIASFKEEEHVVITVSDSGPGIPMEDRDKIFDPFYLWRHFLVG